MTTSQRTILKRIAKTAGALAVLGLAAPAFAQFSNPGFESGAASWTWKQYQGSTISTECTTAPLNSWQPASHHFQPHEGGKAVRMTSFHNPGLTLTEVCSETSQVISVPQGPSSLEFDYKLGDAAPWGSSGTIYHAVRLSVVIEPLSGSAPTTIFSDSGISTMPAPVWESATVSMGDFAGQAVRVRFVTQSRESRTSVFGKLGGQPQSAAYLDNVALDSGTSACTMPPSITPSEGWFLDSAKPNTAVQVSPRGDSLILGWLTFDASGSPLWYFGQPNLDECGTYSGAIYQYSLDRNTNAISSTEVATVNLSFDSYGGASFYYNFAGQSRTTSLSFFQFANGWGTLGLTSFYADLTRPNSGTYVVSQGDVHLIANYVYGTSGFPQWTFGQGSTNGSEVSNVPMYIYFGTGRCPLCTGPIGPISTTSLGDIDLVPQPGGMQIIGHPGGYGYGQALSGGGISWPFSYTPHGQL